MGDDHVAIGAGRLVEVAALGQSEGLGHVDLDVVDVIAVPDRLEQSVGEAEGEDVLGRLLAEEMVDTEDLILIERLVQLLVERDGTGQIRAEGLLHDDSAALDQARLADHVDCGEGRLGRDGEVVQPQLVGAGQHVLRAAHRLPQRLGTGGGRDVVEVLGEDAQILVVELLARPELADGRECKIAEGVGCHLVQGRADDAQVVEQVGLEEVEHPRDELALGEVAGGAEEDDGGRRSHPSRVTDDRGFDQRRCIFTPRPAPPAGARLRRAGARGTAGSAPAAAPRAPRRGGPARGSRRRVGSRRCRRPGARSPSRAC